MDTQNSQKFHTVRLNLWRGFAFSLLMTFGLLSIIATGGGGGGDGDKPGTIALDSATYTVTENTDNTVTITVTRTGGSDGAASVEYATSDGSATTADSDYSSASGTLNWGDGDAAAKTFTVDILDDGDIETPESFTVTLSNVTVASLGSPSSATVTINDDDIQLVPGELQFESTSYNVTEGIDQTVTITVTRTNGLLGTVSVDYATANGTATAPGDYTAIGTTTLTWNAGDATPQTFDVSITNDTVAEVTKSFVVNLSNFVGASPGTNTSTTVTITDDDQITGTVLQ